MVTYVARIAAFLILTLFLLSIMGFALREVAPGNIAVNVLGAFLTPEREASCNAPFGLDGPTVTRYLGWLVGSDWRASRLVADVSYTDLNPRIRHI